jgi:hypothetical protein
VARSNVGNARREGRFQSVWVFRRAAALRALMHAIFTNLQGAFWLWSCDSCLRMRKVKEHYEMSKMRLNPQFDSIRWRAD